MGLILSLSAQAGRLDALGLNFQAPTVYGKANATNPALGEIIFDTSDNTFYGNTDGTGSGWQAFGSPGYQLLSTASATKTPIASGNHHSMTNNSLTLTAGKWRMWCTGNFDSSGGSAGYSSQGVSFRAANGGDNTTSPAYIDTISGLTMLSAFDVNITAAYVTSSSAATSVISSAPYIVECSSSCTIYCDTYSAQASSSNARIKVYMNAERIQ